MIVVHAAISHHLKDAQSIRELFEFEREFFPRLLPTDHIRFIDIYEHFAPEFLNTAYADNVAQVTSVAWENRCETDVQPKEGQVLDQDFCENACDQNPKCLQWQFFQGDAVDPPQKTRCQIYDQLRIGSGNKTGFLSGWRLDRFKEMRSSQWCENRPLLAPL